MSKLSENEIVRFLSNVAEADAQTLIQSEIYAVA
jgi:hypothetical protein